VPRWGDWNYSYLRAIVGREGTWDQLPQRMVHGFAAVDRELAAAPATAQAELNQWMTEQRDQLFTTDRLQQASINVDPVLQRHATHGVASWEEAAQLYLALRARDATRLRAEEPSHPKLQMLLQMRETLRFDEAHESRVFFSAPGDHGPIPYDQFQQQLQQYLLSDSE
jgi:hypothetical protein